jgi:hypothetical protein
VGRENLLEVWQAVVNVTDGERQPERTFQSKFTRHHFVLLSFVGGWLAYIISGLAALPADIGAKIGLSMWLVGVAVYVIGFAVGNF